MAKHHYFQNIPANIPEPFLKLWMDAFDSAFVKAKDAGASGEEADRKAGTQATAAVNQQMEVERTTREHYGGHLVVESDGTKHLPTTAHGALDWGLLDAAYQALFAPEGETRIKEGPLKEKAKARLKELYDKEGMTWPGKLTQDIKPTAGADLTAKALTFSEQNDISYSAALSEVSSEHPELARAAREQALGVRMQTQGNANAELAAMADAVAIGRNISYQQALSLVSQANPGLTQLARGQVLGLRPGMVPLQPTGAADSSTGNNSGDFLVMVQQREEERKLDYLQALSEVARENPELYKRYSAGVVAQKQVR